MKTVAILMGTYNGDKYLREQLDSIFKQKDVDITLFIDDDLSSDNTIDIIKEYAKNYRIYWKVNEKNKNYTYNFLDLLFEVKDKNFDYFALSDQDDVWEEDKIISAINKLEQTNKHLYCSNLKVVDEKLNFIKNMNSFSDDNKYPAHLIFENICTGCTVLFDKEFLSLATIYKPQNIKNHDHWLILVAAFASSYVYDENPHILYRQHANNQIGGLKNESIGSLYNGFLNKHDYRYRMVEELIKGYKDKIPDEGLIDLNLFINYKKIKNKLQICFSSHFRSYVRPLFKKIKILFNKY